MILVPQLVALLATPSHHKGVYHDATPLPPSGMKKKPAWNRNASELAEPDNKIRIEQIRCGMTTRLRKACSHLPEDEFVALVEEMSRVQLGAEIRST